MGKAIPTPHKSKELKQQVIKEAATTPYAILALRHNIPMATLRRWLKR